MGIILGLLLAVFCLYWLALPWANRSAIGQLRQDITSMRNQMDRLEQRMKFADEPVQPSQKTDPAPSFAEKQPVIDESAQTAPKESYFTASKESYFIDALGEKAPSDNGKKETSKGLEQQFGGKLFVWMGGLALALSGFFMVKYSIDNGLLSPAVRTVLGLIFGVLLLGAGDWVRKQVHISNGVRIAQALSGAGLADLYACLFAATSLYDLIPSAVGFAGMAFVTVIAVALSLRHGMPIAVLGMIGGFLTPALVGSNNPSAPLLFVYLYVVLAGLLVVINKRGWRILSLPVIAGSMVWVLIWLFGGHYRPTDGLCLGMFLLVLSATTVATSRSQKSFEDDKGDIFQRTSVIDYASVGGAIILMALIAAHSNFSFMEWGLFGLISMGGIGLAFFDQKSYGFVPSIAIAVNILMLMFWNHGAPSDVALVLSLFAALFIISSYALQWRSGYPLRWAGQVGAASLAYYLLGYFEFRNTTLVSAIPHFWSLLALASSALSVYALQIVVQKLPKAFSEKQKIMALYAAVATAFLSIALSIELDRHFLEVAMAGEVLGLAWISTRVDVTALRRIAVIVACVYGFLMLPQLLFVLQLSVYSLFGLKLYLLNSMPVVAFPAFQLGVPALCFAGSSLFLRKRLDDKIVYVFETVAVALAGLMSYYLMRHAFHVDDNTLFIKVGFIERGAITNVFFVFGLACLWVGRRYSRRAISLCGIALAALAVFRIGYFDLLIHNPLSSSQNVGEFPILNALLVTYGFPILWAKMAGKEVVAFGKPDGRKYLHIFMLVLAFVYVSLSVRQFFHGAYLANHATSSAEIYTYSVVWLIFGAGLLYWGALRHNKMIRVASLIIMMITIGKVFLYDASALTGLWRVFSFSGLGLSLLGLSWFYSRYILGAKQQDE